MVPDPDQGGSPGHGAAANSLTSPPAPTSGPLGTADDDRISLVFRVGVTGHRWMGKDDEAARQAVGEALDAAFSRCTNRTTEWTSVEQAVVSSLADGADRLAAAWAVAHGLRLEII